jgi:hypothetical protein
MRLVPASLYAWNALEADVLATHLIELIKERVARAFSSNCQKTAQSM